jgi:hypothetical protein
MRKALIIVVLVLIAGGFMAWMIVESSKSSAKSLQSQILEIGDKLAVAATPAELARLPKVGTVQIAGGKYTVYYDKTWPRVFIQGRTNTEVWSKVFQNSFAPLSKIGEKVGIVQSRGIGVHQRYGKPDPSDQQRVGTIDSSGLVLWEMSYQKEEPATGPLRDLYLKRAGLQKDFEQECARVTHRPLRIAGKDYAVTSDTSWQFFIVDLHKAKAPCPDFDSRVNDYAKSLAAKHGVKTPYVQIIGRAAG